MENPYWIGKGFVRHPLKRLPVSVDGLDAGMEEIAGISPALPHKRFCVCQISIWLSVKGIAPLQIARISVSFDRLCRGVPAPIGVFELNLNVKGR
jgi:hypothetical protein